MKLIGNKFSMDDAAFLKRVKERCASKGHRADLHLAASEVIDGVQFVTVGFHPQVGQPSETEVRAFVAKNFPEAQIEWKNYKMGQSGVTFSIASNAERIRVESFDKIPPGFSPIGTALYKQAASNAVWSLEKEGDSLVLIRQQDEVPPGSDEILDSLNQGDLVVTPVGVGQVTAKSANTVVVKFPQGEVREFTAQQVGRYDQNKERSSLKDYYTKAYGDPAFADALTKPIGR